MQAASPSFGHRRDPRLGIISYQRVGGEDGKCVDKASRAARSCRAPEAWDWPAHSPSRAGAQGKEPLKLGITEPLTGSEAGYGADFVTVMRMAAKDVNDAGGINGHPLELVVIDTQASPQLGINAANRLATIDKIPMFITAWSAVVKAQAPVANREKVLELSVGANAPDIAKLGDYVYTLFPLAEVDITALAKYTYEKLGKRRAAVAYINNETGIDAAKLYKATFEEASGADRASSRRMTRRPPTSPACC